MSDAANARNGCGCLLIVLLLSLLLFGGCTSETEYGECLGVQERDKRVPGLVYEMDVGNVVIGVLAAETVIVPVVVVLRQFECPVAKK